MLKTTSTIVILSLLLPAIGYPAVTTWEECHHIAHMVEYIRLEHTLINMVAIINGTLVLTLVLDSVVVAMPVVLKLGEFSL